MDIELVITVWDNRKAIRTAAKILKVRSDRVSVHIASVGEQTFRAIFVDGHQQRTAAARHAMEVIRWSNLELPRRYREPVSPQECSK